MARELKVEPLTCSIGAELRHVNLGDAAVAIWDNRSTQHCAVQDFWPAVRKLERAGIIGDRPY